MKKKLLITRVVMVTYEVPYDDNHYPDMTIEQAVLLEQNSGDGDWEETLFENDDITIMTNVKAIETNE